MSDSPFIRLHSGARFHVLRPRREEIMISDICWALSHLNRFTGHSRVPYSVLDHSIRVAELVPDDLKLTALLHDAGEAYCADLNSVVKALVPQYKEIEKRIERAIARRFGLRFPFPAAIKAADMTMLVTEMRDLMYRARYQDYPFEPLAQRIVPRTPEQARRDFMIAFRRYSR